MELREYRSMYQKMTISGKMDENLRDVIWNTQRVKKGNRRKIYRTGVAAVSGLALIVCVAQSKVVFAAVDKIVHYFTYSMTVKNEDETLEKVDMSEAYIDILETAPKEHSYMNSVKDVEDAIGIALLDTKEFYQYQGCVEYSPMISKDGNIYGIRLQDDIYAVGDLQNITLPPREEGGVDSLSYSRGEKYQTPIMAQISIRTDENLNEKYQNKELGLISESGSNLDLSSGSLGEEGTAVTDSEVYEIKSLGVKAVLFTYDSWEGDRGNISKTMATLVYHGVEYVYAGGVESDTMKEFLDTLE